MGVLSWNLAHGRDFPPDPRLHTWRSRLLRATERGPTHAQVNRPLLGEFAGWLAGREWQLALLQEAPPRWQRELGRRTGSAAAIALTSRNSLAPLRDALAEWNPDLIASNEGGSNQLLVRPPARILEVRRLTLSRRPERRRLLWALVGTPDGRRLAVANLHATSGDPRQAARDVELAAERSLDWAGDRALVFGGDLNLRPSEQPGTFERLRERFGLGEPTAPAAIDHLLSRGLEPVAPARALDPGERDVRSSGGQPIRLSDHPPVVAAFGMK